MTEEASAMTDEAELTLLVQRMINANKDAAPVSPAWIATAVMAAIQLPRSLHPLVYAGCHR